MFAKIDKHTEYSIIVRSQNVKKHEIRELIKRDFNQ